MADTGRYAGWWQAVSLDGGVVTFNPPARAVIIGGAGVLNATGVDMNSDALTGELPAGMYPIGLKSINPTNTTATEITVLR